jgi:V/A-type H+-transporting ATPase subunit F
MAVIGDSESIKGFSAVGLDIFPEDDLTQAAALLRHIADSDRYAVIFLTEEVYLGSEKVRARYEERLTPAITPIPGVSGNQNTGTRRLSSFVEKAVGSDIIFNN